MEAIAQCCPRLTHLLMNNKEENTKMSRVFTFSAAGLQHLVVQLPALRSLFVHVSNAPCSVDLMTLFLDGVCTGPPTPRKRLQMPWIVTKDVMVTMKGVMDYLNSTALGWNGRLVSVQLGGVLRTKERTGLKKHSRPRNKRLVASIRS